MSAEPRRCFECNGEGGWYRRGGAAALFAGRQPWALPWTRCAACYGFGTRSAAADKWFETITNAIPVAEPEPATP